MNRPISSLWGVLLLLAFAARAASAQTLYGISNGFGTPAANMIYQIDPATGNLSNMVQVTIPDVEVGRSLALAARPSDGSLWGVVQPVGAPNSGRLLVTINPATGVATPIGVLGDAVSTIAFRADGTLYGVVGDGGTASETLFRISTVDASMTLAFPLGNGADGETIAFHPNGLMYHSSGNGTALFESVDVDTQTVTPIGTASGEAFAMGYSPTLNQMFISDIGSGLYTVDLTTGARTFVGDMSDQLGIGDNRGIAFVTPINDSCGNAIPVANGQTVFGHTTYATNDGSADCAASQTSPDVWYTFVPDCTAFYAASTSGAATNYDTAVSVHTGCPGTVENLVGCDDDSGGNLTSFAVFQGEAGQTYYIRVNGYNNLTGNFQMAVTGLPNDSCDRPIQVFDGTVGFSNRGATTDGSPSGLCTDVSGEQQILADVWFYYFGTCDGQVEVSTCGPIGYDSKLAVYAYEGEICPAGNPLGCNDDACGVAGLSSRVTFQGTVGGIYIIRVGGYFGSNGCGVLNVSCTPDNSCPVCAADYNQDGGVDGADVAAFFLDWENGLPCADVNLDGGIDGADVSFFYAFWEQGNCDS